jgi:hypothetical protein
MARPVAEQLIGAESYAVLDLEFLTNHITSFCLAALGRGTSLNDAGEAPGSAAVSSKQR